MMFFRGEGVRSRGWAALPLMGLFAAAWADDTRLAGQDHTWISFGTYGRRTSTNIRLDTDNIPGTDINLNERFKFGNSVQSARLDLSYRFGRRDRTELSYYRSSNTRSATLTSDLTIAGITFDAGTGVSARQQIDEFQWRWKRSFFQEKNYEVGFSLGAHTLAVRYNVSGLGSIQKRARANGILPLPLGGLYGEYWFSKRWSISGSYEILALRIENYSGRVTDVKYGIDYHANDRFSLGLGFASFTVRVNADVPGFDGQFRTRYSGLRAYATYRF
ncbi:MAG: hypothetical protein SFX74_00340 [Fimbriimonadaceae bacterium]|nr:hypothetical protein [Fimbriimonadaceae bacterium]